MNIQDLMKQAQKMQKEMGEIEKELNEKIYVGTAGGAVKAKVDGTYSVQGIEIEQDVLGDKEFLEEMLLLALNDAIAQAKEEREEKLGALTQGMGLPGGF